MRYRLPEELGRRRLIGFGEVTHGSGGLHELAATLMIEAIQRFDIETLLFEAPYGVIEPINERLGRGEPIEAVHMRDLYFNWRSVEILRFLNQISDLNRHGKRVSLVGIDVRQPATDLKRLQLLTQDLKHFPVDQADVQSFSEFEKQILSHHRNLSRELADDLTDKLCSLESNSKLNTSSENLMAIRRLKSWIRMYQCLSDISQYDQGFLFRDQGMSEMAQSYLLNNKRPVLIWAHLAHLVFDSCSVKSKHSWFSVGDLLGSSLRRKLQNDYSLVAIMARSTEVTLANGDKETFHPRPDSIENKGPTDSEDLTVLIPEHLLSEKVIKVGATTTESAVKATYIEMEVEGVQQFDYAAIRAQSSGLRDVCLDC